MYLKNDFYYSFLWLDESRKLIESSKRKDFDLWEKSDKEFHLDLLALMWNIVKNVGGYHEISQALNTFHLDDLSRENRKILEKILNDFEKIKNLNRNAAAASHVPRKQQSTLNIERNYEKCKMNIDGNLVN